MTPPARAAGMATTTRRFISGDHLGQLGRRCTPARSAATQTNTSCASPANGTVQTSQRITSPPIYAAQAIDIQTKIFKSTGAAAAAAKRPVALRTPENKAVIEIRRM